MKKNILCIMLLSVFSLIFVTGCSLTNAIDKITNDEVTLKDNAKEIDDMVNESANVEDSIEDLSNEIDSAVESLK